MTVCENSENQAGLQNLFRTSLLVGALVVSIVVIRYTPLGHVFRLSEAPRWRIWLLDYGTCSHVVFVAGGTIMLLLGVPRTALAGVGGAVFGPLLGIVWTETACMVAGFAAFAFARWIAGDIVLSRLGKYPRLDRQFRENGFLTVLLIRLCPVGHNQLTNFICGTSPVSVRDFFWASLLGLLPENAAFALIGAGVIEHPWSRLTLGAALLAALSFTFWWIYRRSGTAAEVTKELT